MLTYTRFTLEASQTAIGEVSNGKAIVSKFLAEYILVIFCAEMEGKIKDALFEALRNETSPSLASFISNTLETIFKRICKKDLAKTIAFFGDEKKMIFNELLDEVTVQKYSNYITDRHNVAHPGNNTSLSWQEVQEIADIGEAILSAFRSSLNLPSHTP